MIFLILATLAFQLDLEHRDKVVDSFKMLDRFEVRFKQETFSDFFEDSIVEGFLQVSRPGRMRMEFQKGDRKTLIWNGVTCYERDMLADTESRSPQEEVKDEPLVRILLYGDDVGRMFLIDRYKNEAGDIYRFRPRDNQKWVVEVIFDEQWLPKILEIMDEEGEGTRFYFHDYNLDPEFGEKSFTIPAEKKKRP